ncbi:MAG: HAMP domain-containing protein, partial [Myxococcales bacterium]|nr:HAMP domain-containing protein [Myxococcales bacterium]
SELSYKRFDAQRHNIFLVDSRSRIIAHGDPARVGSVATAIAAQKLRLQKNRAYSLEIERDGERYLTAVLPIVELGWGVVVQQRQRDAYAAIRNTWLTGLGAGAGLAVMALILGFIFGGRFSKPVLELARAASQVANGKFDTRVTVTTGDEIGEMAGAFNQMADDLRTYREKVIEETRIRTDLSRYLGPDVVEQIVSRRESLKLGGERRIVTVMFADVVAFTPLAEKVNPERIVGILNELFTFVTEIIFKHGGIIDKFIGDCVMAVFGTPTRHDDDPTRCVRAAEEIMQWLAVGNAKWKQELGSELQIAIGVNTGEVIAGNIGSEKRMEYTVIGDAVNIASRLESMAQPGQILISRTTAELLDPEEFEFAHLGAFNLVGRTATTDVYRLAEE